MNSQHAANAAKNELPIVYKGQGGTVQIFRRIKALTYHYAPEKKASVLLEDRRFQQSNIWAALAQVEVISSCRECPETDRRNCGACIFNVSRRDVFTCKSCKTCANFQNDCKDWNSGKLCLNYGDCTLCMNEDDICCEQCIYQKEVRDKENDEQEDKGLSPKQDSI